MTVGDVRQHVVQQKEEEIEKNESFHVLTC
jgi:hypothetical protein